MAVVAEEGWSERLLDLYNAYMAPRKQIVVPFSHLSA